VSKRNERPWLVITLGVLCIVAIVVAYTTVGQASQSTAQSTRTATVAKGVVQSTVSGSGNLQSASQLNLGFKTSGVVTHIYVAQGQHVTEGQLLATLNPESAEVTLAQAKASLQSAEANLSQEEESHGETSTGQSSGTGSGAQASTSSVHNESVALTASTGAATPRATTPASTPTTATTTPPTTTTPTSTTTTPSTTTTTPTTPTTTTSPPTQTSTSTSKPPAKTTPSAGESKEGEQQSGGSSSAKSKVTSATREANLASAEAAVKSDRLTAQSAEQAVQDTKLYAPQDGTIVSLSGEVGETVSASGTTKASSSSSSSGGSSTGTGTGTGASALGGASTGASSSSTGSSSSSSFAVLSDLSSMQVVVALSESEIGNVHVGQIATVTVEALSGAKLAARVSEVATLSTSSSGAVSYDVTFQLEQLASGLKPGMSATAEVVVKQAEGINVPTSAVTADSVTVERAGKQVSQAVTTGLAGNSSTIILSGLKAGETVVLPAASTTGSSGASLTSRLGGLSKSGGLGGGLGGGGGFPGGGGGGGFPVGGPP
jgi:multidrug efflux pump subunit AcrA (membrane-fusion protein)